MKVGLASRIQVLSLYLIPGLRKLPVVILLFVLGSPIWLLKEGYVGGDAFYYLDMARYFYQTGIYIIPTDHFLSLVATMRSPLFPLLLTGMFHIAGPAISSATIVTKASAFLSLCLVYLLGKQLYGWRVGLVAVSLAATSRYLVDFPAHLALDQVQSLFMLLSLYVYILAFRQERHFYSILAGTLLGMGFLIKESAVLWVTLPLLAFLVIDPDRCAFNFVLILEFWLGFCLPPGLWFVYYFIYTGKGFLLDSVFVAWIRPLLGQSVGVGFALLVTGVIILLIAFLFGRRRALYFVEEGVVRIAEKAKILGKVVGWLTLVSLLTVFTITLTRMGTWMYSLAEIFPRLVGFWDLWYQVRVVPEQPLLYYAPFALIVVALLAVWRKNKSDALIVVCVMAYLPLFLAAGFKGRYYWPGRYFMTIFWLSYLFFGRVLILFAGVVSWAISGTKLGNVNLDRKLTLNSLSLMCVPLCLMQVVFMIMHHDPMTPSNVGEFWNNKGVEVASTWISEHLPPGTRLASTQDFLVPLDFYTKGQYQWFELFDYGRNQDLTPKPIDNETTLFRLDDGLHLARYRGFNVEAPIISDSPLYVKFWYDHDYVQVVARPEDFDSHPVYLTLDQDRLERFIKEQAVDYVVLTVGPNNRMFDTVLSCFADTMDLIFHTTWDIRTGKIYTYELYIFQIKQGTFLSKGYPVSIESRTYQVLADQVNELTGGDKDPIELLRALGLKPVLITPPSRDNFSRYRDLAEAFARHDQVDLAAIQYHIALSEAPTKAAEILNIADQLSSVCSDCVGAYVLMGEAYRTLRQFEAAKEAYLNALAAPYGSDAARAIAHRGMGLLYLSMGQNQQAIQEFECSIKTSAFGAAETRQQLLIAQGNFSQASGDIEQAIASYREALNADLNSFGEAPNTSLLIDFDFVRQFDQNQARLSGNASIHPAVFIVDDRPRPVLFAHPISEISYTLHVPANARFVFAPVLAPELWQPGKGDGVQFDLYIDDGRARQVVFSKYIDSKNVPDDRRWREHELDFSSWAGQTVTLTFATGCGPNNNCDYDWAGWGEPRIVQPVAYDFLEHFGQAITSTQQFGQVYTQTQTINYETRSILFQHPSSRVQYALTLPQHPTLAFGLGVAPDTWSPDKGDGVEYNVYVRKPDEPYVLYRVFHRYLDPKNDPDDRRWFDERVDLGDYGGQAVDIIFEASPGPAGNTDFDWGGWSSPVLIDETPPGQDHANALDLSRQSP